MKILKGYYINLDESRKRRKSIEDHLRSLNLANHYRRFPASKGSETEAKGKNLSRGEVGLWKSWLSLLANELKSDEEYSLLHILEDDARLTIDFSNTIREVVAYSHNFDMLATDMYVNPSIYNALVKQHNQLKNQNKFAIHHGLYTGCTSSIVIAKGKIQKVYSQLKEAFTSNQYILPIDNYLRLAHKENKIEIARMAPFTTTIEKDDVLKSTIQSLDKQEKAVVLTTTLCTLLRKELSVDESRESACEILKVIQKLAITNRNDLQPGEVDKVIIQRLLEIASRENLLRYSYKSNLIGQPDNPQ